MTAESGAGTSTVPPTGANTDPRTVNGVGVGHGVAVGPAVILAPSPSVPAADPVEPAGEATARVQDALGGIAAQLRERAGATQGTLAGALTATATMAEDPALLAAVTTGVRSGLGTATAFDRAIEQFAQTFRDAGGYLAERVTDLMSVRDRGLARLLDLPEPGIPALTQPSVVVADDLSPADTAAVDLALVAAIVTAAGGPTSHTAIIARQVGIPCVVGAVGVLELPAGARVLVDAGAGVVICDPAQEVVAAAQRRAERLADLSTDQGETATADGHRVQLLANIGTAQDAQRAASTAVDGVGLFRTEVLFLDQVSAPSAQEQTAIYRAVFEHFGGRKVVTRTLDAGADKPLAFATLPDEQNPALGVRGYRTARAHPELLADQLTALAAAATDSEVESWVMAPMIATAAEAQQFAALARARGIEKVGAMVEVPSAALKAEQLLETLDFLSIGTNDLAQYTMAADRLSADLVDLTDPWQPAILELVARTAQAGIDQGKPVGVCGESAADPLMALVLTGLGITSLSMSAPSLAAVRYAVRRHTARQCHGMADTALGAADAAAARGAVVARLDPEVRETLNL